MKLDTGHTPAEAAVDIALGWLRGAYTGKTGDLETYSHTPAQRREAKRAIAKLHNRLLRTTKLDGVELDEEVGA